MIIEVFFEIFLKLDNDNHRKAQHYLQMYARVNNKIIIKLKCLNLRQTDRE